MKGQNRSDGIIIRRMERTHIEMKRKLTKDVSYTESCESEGLDLQEENVSAAWPDMERRNEGNKTKIKHWNMRSPQSNKMVGTGGQNLSSAKNQRNQSKENQLTSIQS